MERSASCPPGQSQHGSPVGGQEPSLFLRPGTSQTSLTRGSLHNAGSVSWASRSVRFRRACTVRRTLSTLELDPLPPLSKGALRHRIPKVITEKSNVQVSATSIKQIQSLVDFDAAEAFGRKMLGEDSWIQRIFEECDGASTGYLWPAEFAAMAYRFEQAMGGFHGRFQFTFNAADSNLEGRVAWGEFENFVSQMVQVFGETRCRVAAQRVLGSRRAEARRKVKNVFVFDGYDPQASLRLIDVCSKGHKNSSLVEDVRSALAAKADPNAGLASPAFNNYTPLIFLAMAQLCSNGGQIAKAIEVLIMAGADVHRECGQMATGRLVPLRFAARTQNMDGLATLEKYVDLGDTFQWAAGENAVGIMLNILRRLHGEELADRIAMMDAFSTKASIQLRFFASPLIGGTLSADGAARLCAGKYDDGFIRHGEKADPNSPGLEGKTVLIYMVIQGNVEVVESLLAGRASPHQRDSSGATPLHYAACHAQPAVARALLRAGAEPHASDQAGFSPWMLVGEACCFYTAPDGRTLPCTDRDISAARDSVRECLELLKPRFTPEELLDKAEESIGSLLDSLEGETQTMEAMEKVFRLQESLFFNPRMAIKGAFEGRMSRQHLLLRLADVMIQLLTTDPLEGIPKILTKYLLTASMGPDSCEACAHVSVPWEQDDNRSSYRTPLMQAVKAQLGVFSAACGVLRKAIDGAAAKVANAEAAAVAAEAAAAEAAAAAAAAAKAAAAEAEVAEGVAPETADDADTADVPLGGPESKAAQPQEVPEPEPMDEAGLSCAALLQVEADIVLIPTAWQQDPYWEMVQQRQVLRWDPTWARGVCDGASACLALLRLGVPADDANKLKKKKEMCVVSSLADYSELRQVQHAQFHELFGRGYVTYSNLCNKPFQDKMKEIAARARDAAGLDVGFPEHLIGAKRLKRIMEKTREAQVERAGWEWPDRPELYTKYSYCFYILDTVRLSFGCKGATVPEQVQCCMRLLEEFENCTVEKDGVQLLRKKSGFASKGGGAGGYSDVKMLVYADLGVHNAFDGTEIPLQIVGEVQLILEGYEAVKHRMHLVYEVDRGSFDRKR